MKVVGKKNEVQRFLDELQKTICPEFFTNFASPSRHYTEKIPNGYIGRYQGVDIDIEIIEELIHIGMITDGLTEKEIRLYAQQIADRHGKVLRCSAYKLCPTRYSAQCFDGSTIESFKDCSCIRGYKFDELWMNSLPSSWDEFDAYIISVIGDRNKIHFYKEIT